jgi:hypothetical protein
LVFLNIKKFFLAEEVLQRFSTFFFSLSPQTLISGIKVNRKRRQIRQGIPKKNYDAGEICFMINVLAIAETSEYIS